MLVNGFDRVPWEFLDDAANRSLTDELATQVQKVVDGYRPDVQAILDVLRQGECRFEYDFRTREPYNIPLPHVQNLRNVQRVLVADCHIPAFRGVWRTTRAVFHEARPRF